MQRLSAVILAVVLFALVGIMQASTHQKMPPLMVVMVVVVVIWIIYKAKKIISESHKDNDER
tara:strand:- start:219 stop:404 length:186 start_codon:yes stop_codon:yes gene_type:complete